MKMKHTPGPWEAHALSEGYAEVRAGEVLIADLHFEEGSSGFFSDAESMLANARLIAAAPELLDELIEQDKFLGVLAGTVPLSEKDTHRRIAMHRESVRAAIAKATGQ